MYQLEVVRQDIGSQQRPHDSVVELPTRMRLQLLHHRHDRQGSSVWAVGQHSVNGVADNDDLGANRNLIPEQAIRIALAVLPLVMMSHRHHDVFVDRG